MTYSRQSASKAVLFARNPISERCFTLEMSEELNGDCSRAAYVVKKAKNTAYTNESRILCQKIFQWLPSIVCFHSFFKVMSSL